MLFNQICTIKYRLKQSWACWRIMKLCWGQPAHPTPDMQMLSTLNQRVRCPARLSLCENSVCVSGCAFVSGMRLQDAFLSFDPVRKVPSCRKCFTPWLSASQPQWFISALGSLGAVWFIIYTQILDVYHCSYWTSLVKEVALNFKPTQTQYNSVAKYSIPTAQYW